MEVNKEQAEKCRDLGAAALRGGDFPRAAKMLLKSLQLYPLPGVEALYTHAKGKLDDNEQDAKRAGSGSGNNTTNTNTNNGSSSSRPTASTTSTTPRPTTASPARQQNAGADGRAYTEGQVRLVQNVLSAKEGGRGAHYRVLEITPRATESEIKKAYRKLSLKVHPDKNSAPHADEAFKSVGLAYATLSDPQKRTIYDRYGEEDPDNRGASRAAGGGMGGVNRRHGGQEMSPEDIFQAFFGGGMPGGGGGGGPGVHFYSNGFGPGMQFRAGGGPRRGQQQQQQQRGGGQAEPQAPGLGMLMQLLPVLLFMALSFLSQSDTTQSGSARPMSGENQYFSLTNKPPFTNPSSTRLSKVKDIPYFVTDKFLRTYHRDRYQLSQVEHMVERAYENYLVYECKAQREYKKRLWTKAQTEQLEEEKAQKLKLAKEFELSRCDELADFFPARHKRTV